MQEVTDGRKQTYEWSKYQLGLDYKRRITLFTNVDKNEQFYSGNQWAGVKANGLPTPVFNITRQIIDYKISNLLSQQVKMNYAIDGVAGEDAEQLQVLTKALSGYSETLWERLKMDMFLEQVLKNGAVTGDGCLLFYWDNKVKTGTKVKGDLRVELVDNVNIFPGNPNDTRIENQPYILIAYRALTADLIEEAKAHGVDKAEIAKITDDMEWENQSGERGKIEIQDAQKTICLLKMWKKDGKVYAKKSTRYAEIRPEWDMGLTRYPVAMMNWYLRTNSFHGEAEATHWRPNQIAINKMFAMSMMSLMFTAFPKLIYDQTVIQNPSNTIGAAIPVNGPIQAAATYLQPMNNSPDAWRLIDNMLKYTKDISGASDAALGSVNPENRSAIIEVRETAAQPLENIKRRLYQLVEDIAYIFIDFFTQKYDVPRLLKFKDETGQDVVAPVDMSKFKDYIYHVKVDVGAGGRWSEISTVQTLDNLLQGQFITFKQYLERLPQGIVPKREMLLMEIKEQEAAQQAMMQEQAQAPAEVPGQAPPAAPMPEQAPPQQAPEQAQGDPNAMIEQLKSQLPDDVQRKLDALPDDQLVKVIQQLIHATPEQLQEFVNQVRTVGGVQR